MKDTRRLEDLTDQLYSALDQGHYLGRSCPWRPVILKAVFKLLDQESPRLLLKLARLILAVSQNSVLSYCKVLCYVVCCYLKCTPNQTLLVQSGMQTQTYECVLLWSPYVIGQTIIFLPCSFFPSFFSFVLLWSPYVIGQTIIFLPCSFFPSFFSSSFFFLA